MKNKLRIAVITTDARHWFQQHDTENPNFGTAVQSLMQGFCQLEFIEVHVISASPSQLKSTLKLADNIWFHHVHVPKWGWGRCFFLGVAFKIRKLIKSLNVDIVHGQGTERDCSLAAVMSGFPNVLTIHGNMRVHASRPEHQGSLYYKMAAMLESFCLRRTKGVVAISRYTDELVKSLCCKTWLLPNAVDQRFFHISLSSRIIPRILFVGSLDERKNPLGLLRACEPLLRQGLCTLAMAGKFHAESSYGEQVMNLAKNLPGIEFLGFMDRDSLAKEFSRSSLLVLPTFEDNCPMVILEAMAAGLPVAASNVGGVPDLVQNGSTGLMFDPNSEEEIRSVIESLIRDPYKSSTFGLAGRSYALEHFHPKVIAEEHIKIYREVLGDD